MNLLFPLGLAALASVLLPLVLHLARRTEQRPTDFAALRWLRQKPRPRHRPRFDERLLLAVRLLLLAGIALVLAQPIRAGDGDGAPVIAVAPGAVVPTSTARRIWLAPGFPAIDTPRPAGPQPVASLIRQLDADLPAKAALTIIVPRTLDGADAERPRLSRAVTWRVAGEGRAPAPVAAADPPMLRYDAALPGSRYIVAAVRALGGTDVGPLAAPFDRSGRRPGPDPRAASQPGPRNPSGARERQTRRPLIWLGVGALPAPVADAARAGSNVLVGRDAIVPAAASVVVWRDATGAPLVEAQPFGEGRLLRFTRALSPAVIPQLLEPGFPRRLAALFAAAPEPRRVSASAYTPRTGATAAPPPARPLWPWLAVGVAALFCVERWLATGATRAPSP